MVSSTLFLSPLNGIEPRKNTIVERLVSLADRQELSEAGRTLPITSTSMMQFVAMSVYFSTTGENLHAEEHRTAADPRGMNSSVFQGVVGETDCDAYVV
jgi:hypothetical protein